MLQFAIRLIRKALTIIIENFQGMNRWWGLKNKFEERRSPKGELLLAVSIIGNMVPVLYPILGGAPFLISLILVIVSIVSYWLLRMGISDPRLWNWTVAGIGLEMIGLILGGFYLPHVGINVIHHILKNVVIRSSLAGFGSLVWAASTYLVSAQPGEFEGEKEPSRLYKAASISDYAYTDNGITKSKKNFKLPDFGDYDYYNQWNNAEYQHNK